MGESRRRAGFGLIVTEGTYTDAFHSQAYEFQPGLVTREQVEGWRAAVEAVHSAGGRIVAQLMHAGALSQHLEETVGPSAVVPLGEKMPEYGGRGPFPIPQEATEAQLHAAIEGFASAASAAREAAFDGVEVHGANGYLIDQFLTDYTNRRADRYGGDATGRARLAVEVVTAIRAAVGPDFLVGIRLSQTKVNDFSHRWRGREEALAILSAVGSAGPDFLHIASEGRDWRATDRLDDGQTVTSLAREICGKPVIANGGMHDPEQAIAIVSQGEADLVSIARGAIANPDWPSRVREGLSLREFDGQVLQPRADIDSQRAWEDKHANLASCQVGAKEPPR
ncbi:MAG TPA: NADH:flavin oxidoreductase [Solirubrobacterales bacterium]|nr:NADH:flavin oxidoreductase [Solirubrobacterales bacterium]